MRNLLPLVLACVSLTVFAAERKVKLGIDVLRESNFEAIAGKRVGLVAHPASVDSRGVSSIEVLHGARPRVQLVALFGPEHGLWGDEIGGEKIGDRTDARTGLPVYSLYGKTRKPTTQTTRGLDALLFDLQDIGCRSYTYVSTMKACMEGCAEQDLELIILDRPNPLGGQRIEGPRLEKQFSSFIGAIDVPYVHGMTMGELAQLVRDRYVPQFKKLRVIKMQGWDRKMTWADTGLMWVPTSPNIPQARSCADYVATGLIGELLQLSIGIGTTQPFQTVGSPDVNAGALADALNQHWDDPRGYYAAVTSGRRYDGAESPGPKHIRFRPTSFTPLRDPYKDQRCYGVQPHFDPADAETFVQINFRILQALDAPAIFERAGKRCTSFDKACGSDEPRLWLSQGKDPTELFAKWQRQCEQFRKDRQKYLLY